MEPNNNERAKGKGEEEEEKPPKPSCCTRFKTKMSAAGKFMYNKETHEVMGRGGMSWLKILCFYAVFYAVLAGFFAICMAVFIKSLDPIAPTLQKFYSLMKDNPGMNFQPVPDNTATLVMFNMSNATDWTLDTNYNGNSFVGAYNNSIQWYFNKTRDAGGPGVYKSCNMTDGATVNQACSFDIESFLSESGCSLENNFGMVANQTFRKPCIILRINKVFLWQPETFNKTCDPDKSKNDPDCTRRIEFDALPARIKSQLAPGYIAMSCQGENDGDMDNLNGVRFYPEAGFPSYYFPYYNQPGYLPPLVVAEFDVVPGRALMIWCRFWTNNVIHDQNDLQGSLHLELFVDESLDANCKRLGGCN